MYKSSKLLLNLCLSGLVATLAVVGTNTATYSSTDITKSNLEIANACAGANPCAGGNPCAGAKVGSVGGPLSPELQGKPVVVDIYATWCAGCKNIAPTLSQIKQQYADKVHFVVLDVSDKSKAQASEAKARELGLGEFFASNKSKTSTVAIIDPATGDILAIEKNNPDKSAYTEVLDDQLAQK